MKKGTISILKWLGQIAFTVGMFAMLISMIEGVWS